MRIAASLDEHSTHPVAKALVAGWRAAPTRQARRCPSTTSACSTVAVSRASSPADSWRLGNHRLVEELGVCSPALEARLATLEEAGKTAIVLCAETGPVAVFGVADTVRPESVDGGRGAQDV